MNMDMDGPVARQAADWLTRLDRATPEVEAEFLRWLKQAPDHAKELLIAQANDVVLRALTRNRHFDVDIAKLRSGSNICEFGDPTDPRESRRFGHRGSPRVERDDSRVVLLAPAAPPKAVLKTAKRARWLAAAAVFFVTVLTAATLVFQSASHDAISTRAGEWHTKILDDGTVMRVGPRTKLVVEFTNERRVVQLKYGEALFHVAKNPERPFLVETELATARAIGTAFAVSAYDPEHVRVTVKEGIVAVTRAAAHFRGRGRLASKPGKAVTLGAGDQVGVTPAGVLPTRQVDIEAALAWATGRLIFVDEDIEQAVLEFNRRNKIQIKVTDKALLRRPVRGKFDASDPEEFARQLESLGAVSEIDKASGTLLIAPDPHPMAIRIKN